MGQEIDVMDYDSVGDLEDTIEGVHQRVERLDSEMGTLLNQIGAFLNYEHDPEKFRSAAEYVSSNIPDEALPGIAMQYAQKHLDEEQIQAADNWDKLEEAQEKAEYLSEQWRTAYSNLWENFGYQGDRLNEEINGIPPVQHFLDTWDEKPHRLFEPQERYDNWDERMEEGHKPTMARYFEVDNPSSKQLDDLKRETQFEQEEKREDHGRTFEEDQDFWRDHLSDKPGFSKWVDQTQTTANADKKKA